MCNLPTIGLPNMIDEAVCDEEGNATKFFNYDKLYDVVHSQFKSCDWCEFTKYNKITFYIISELEVLFR